MLDQRRADPLRRQLGRIGEPQERSGGGAVLVDSGPDSVLDAYSAARRAVAEQVVRFTLRLTRLATLPGPVRPARNAAMRTVAAVPAVPRRLAWRLSGLVYR